MRKNWNQIDKMALNAMKFILNYCDIKDMCDDCIFCDPDDDDNCCQLRRWHFDLEKFIEEIEHD